MTILDRFRTQPRQRHADPAVRLAFVEELPVSEREVLAEMAREDPDGRVRRAAVGKLMDPTALATVASGDGDESVREQARTMLRDIALDAFEGVAESDSLAAVDALNDGKTLAAIAKAALRENVAVRALARIDDGRALGSIARHAPIEPVRLGALAALQDRQEILNVAINSEFKDTAAAAVERLAERADLDAVVVRGKNKSGVKRARMILHEMDERDAQRLAAEEAERAERARVEREERLQELDAERRAEEEARQREEIEATREREEASTREAEEREAVRQREEEDAARRRADAEAERARQEEEGAERQRREAEAREADMRVRREALTRLQQLATRVEQLTAKPDLTLKAGERALRDMRAALGAVPPMPSRADYEEISRRLKAAQSALTPRVQELRDALEWQRFANVAVQEQLCQRMEALAAVDDPEKIAHDVRVLQEEWRRASDVPRTQAEALWRRFKAAHDVAWAKCEAHFAEQAQARAENLARKVALAERAEALADSTHWIQTAEAIKALQAEWKTIGPVTRGSERAVRERFRAACDRFFTRRHADLVDRKKVWAENLAKKEALCARAEALADSTDWDAAAAEIRRLQSEWKTIGPVKKNRSEALWQRFRGASDRFFARHAARHDTDRAERIAAREAICAELDALADPEAADVVAKVRDLRRRWQQEIAARAIDRVHAAELDERFRAAFARVIAVHPASFEGTDLDPSSNRKRMEALVRRVEELAGSMAPGGATGDDQALSPTTRLAAMLKEALAANTIGGRVDETSRWRAAADEVRQAQTAWSRIGPVPDDVRRELLGRFDRACRWVMDRAGRAGGPGGAGGPGKDKRGWTARTITTCSPTHLAYPPDLPYLPFN